MKSYTLIINYLLLELVLILFFISAPKAQPPGFITGIVKDAGTGLPIENVNITLYQTTRGTISDSRGIFKIRIFDFPAVLQFSHVSYYKKSIVINTDDVDTIIVLLNQRPVNLNEAEIISGKYKVLKDENKEVVDYDFIDTNLLVLIRNMNTLKYELIVTSDQFDTINKLNISTVKHPKSIFKDCMGNCHLLTKDSAYQVYFNNKTIQLLFPVNLNRFKMLLGNCLFETPKYLVFNYKSNTHPELMYAARKPEDITKPSKNGNWKQQFYAINKQTHRKKIIDEFDEPEKRREAFEDGLLLVSKRAGV
ncbi:MAG: hypothetical protein DRJ09_08555 [Bacteroidetes bacterium]|nr:MAG: hypothetical protein DRJ09_08555 [Bacteroidota bacterium]